MKITHYSLDVEGNSGGIKSPSLWVYDDKGAAWPVIYFQKPKYMKKKDFTRILERLKLEIYKDEELF